MKTVYVVMGSTGEYSDRREWAVRAFLSKDDAERLVRDGDDWARTNGVSPNHMSGDHVYYEREEVAKSCPLGACDIDYTGVSWYVMDVPLDDGASAGERHV